MGVMKAVGEAVEERQTYEWGSFGYTHKLRCIGIAPWGYVERNNMLLRKDNIFEGVSVKRWGKVGVEETSGWSSCLRSSSAVYFTYYIININN